MIEQGDHHSHACCAMSRRVVLAAAAGLGLSTMAWRRAGAATASGIVDVHAHFTPAQYVRDFADTKLVPPPSLQWTLERHLAEMEKSGVSRSILSLTAPGLKAGDVERARKMARYVNEDGASLVQRHPSKFGLFAAIPLMDPEGSLAEIAYALDELKANGIGIFTNYEGVWIGDPRFDPVFEELNRREAIVYVHPIVAPCCAGTLPYLRDAIIEYPTDVTRAITNYIYKGAASKFPKVKMIFSHAGGTMPYLMGRFDEVDERFPFAPKAAPEGYRNLARRFFYDTAQSLNHATMTALREVVSTEQIVFGTDFPYFTMTEHVADMSNAKVFTPAELALIKHGNVERALPRLMK